MIGSDEGDTREDVCQCGGDCRVGAEGWLRRTTR